MAGMGPQLCVLTQSRQATLKPEELVHFRPADQAADVLPTADVVLITGTTLVIAEA